MLIIHRTLKRLQNNSKGIILCYSKLSGRYSLNLIREFDPHSKSVAMLKMQISFMTILFVAKVCRTISTKLLETKYFPLLFDIYQFEILNDYDSA